MKLIDRFLLLTINLKKWFGISFIIFTIAWLLFLTWSCKTFSKLIVFTAQISNTTLTLQNISKTRSSWLRKIHQQEFKIYSQNGEDGVLLWIFANIGTINHPPYFVEFGTENGDECNTRFLRQQLGWQGLMMDGNHEIPYINLHKENITSKNINDLLTKHQTPSLIDLLSIDVE
jgi:hypothetical protein